jgi:multiple sugar transport system substrate-binding protein
MKFISETGYLPVTRDAFEVSIEQYINKVDNINIKKLLKTAVTMYNEYDFYIPPVFDEFDSMEKTYTVRIKQAALDARTSYLSFLDREDAEEAFKHLTQNIYDALIE